MHPADARRAVRGAQRADEATVTLDISQAVNAATIAAAAHSSGLPERAVTIALATAIQESELRDIDYGERDSLGLFQQHPSQDWGTPAQVLDPVYASEKFYDALINVPGCLSLSMTAAAQRSSTVAIRRRMPSTRSAPQPWPPR
ncbi:hypothetical protein ACFC0C_04290 [Streptomyces sp. NPDC056178]|uniref:hypothetical protein n=1 Tax=unclassified Streptomyces TaxID=2593676 RepID=UPI0035DBDD11